MYDKLIQNTHLAATVIFLLAVLYLLAGLASPSLARASGRGSVVLRSLLGMVLAFGLAIGVIVYTHMQPDGPHSIDTYIREHDWEQYRTQPSDGSQRPQPVEQGQQ